MNRCQACVFRSFVKQDDKMMRFCGLARLARLHRLVQAPSSLRCLEDARFCAVRFCSSEARPKTGRGRGSQRVQSVQSKRAPPRPPTALNAVFKVLSTHCEPYYTMPWSTSPQTTAAASAVALVVEGIRYLVTNAHAVHHASLLELQKPSDDLKCLARVLCQGPGLTLFVLLPCG